MALMSAVAAIVRANWRKNWPVIPPRNAVGQEHRHQHQRDGDDRPGHLVHRLDRRLLGGSPSCSMWCDGVLDDHDGVVDHDADGQHQAEQREQVDREAEQRP